jgi:hypothetical protein
MCNTSVALLLSAYLGIFLSGWDPFTSYSSLVRYSADWADLFPFLCFPLLSVSSPPVQKYILVITRERGRCGGMGAGVPFATGNPEPIRRAVQAPPQFGPSYAEGVHAQDGTHPSSLHENDAVIFTPPTQRPFTGALHGLW